MTPPYNNDRFCANCIVCLLATFPRFVFSTAGVHVRGIARPHKCGTGVETMYFSFVIDSPREFGSGNES